MINDDEIIASLFASALGQLLEEGTGIVIEVETDADITINMLVARWQEKIVVVHVDDDNLTPGTIVPDIKPYMYDGSGLKGLH